jgi:hypothetical protein
MFNMSLIIRRNDMTKPLLCVAAALLLGASSTHSLEKTETSSPKDAEAATLKPTGWGGDNFFLGRWQGNSTAGRAVLGVLTLEPNRVRWGNLINGICDSDYSVEHLPWGRDGRFPDQLVPPSQPTDLVYAVVRLTLQPRPCKTGVVMIQLAQPLDSSDSLQVVTYGVKGEMRGNYPGLTKLP